MTCNISLDAVQADQFYRYKMPIPIVTFSSNKTIVSNSSVIAKSLKVPLEWISAYFKYSGAISCVKDGELLINGKVELAKVRELLQKFIELYVLCERCKLPEVKIESLNKACEACGYRGKVTGSEKMLKVLSAKMT